MADTATKLKNQFRPTSDFVCGRIERFRNLNLLLCSPATSDDRCDRKNGLIFQNYTVYPAMLRPEASVHMRHGYGKAEAWLHLFLTSVLDVCECLASRYSRSRFIPVKELPLSTE
jgi:hypothetical protein